MSELSGFERKIKTEMPVVAICYDFDRTLSPDDMQAQGYIQSVGYNIPDFWDESNALAFGNDMDQNLAYMYKMLEKSKGKFPFTRETLQRYGAGVKLFPGVEEWFDRIREYGRQKGVIVEHYVISSGLKEMIEGTKVADAFEKIYASSYYFDENGEAKWPAQVINYTNKTQFLFRIQKGVLAFNDPAVNEFFSPEDLRIPFRNMVYIGDSDTDVPCMTLVNLNGGHSIGVYDEESGNKDKVYKMMDENRIKYFAPANYTDGSELDRIVKSIIDKTAVNEKLENLHCVNKKECVSILDKQDKNEKVRIAGIIALRESTSFATTHTVIGSLKNVDDWKRDEIEELCKIALENSQVKYIFKDADVKMFFKQLLKNAEEKSEAMKEVSELVKRKK